MKSFLMRKTAIILLALLFVLAACSKSPTPQASSETSTDNTGIGYPTVQAALTALKAKPGVKIRDQQGWTMIEDPVSKDAYDLWAFAPQGNPAYPAAVKRTIYKQEGQVFIKMTALCESSKTACDALVSNFKALNDQIKAEIIRRAKAK
jgi:hypothetical protein